MGPLADWFEEFIETMEATLLNKWLWIIIGGMCAVAAMPLVLMWVMMVVPAWLSATIAVLVIIGWGVAGGYKDYLLHRRKLEEARSRGGEFDIEMYDEYVEKRRRYRPRP